MRCGVDRLLLLIRDELVRIRLRGRVGSDPGAVMATSLSGTEAAHSDTTTGTTARDESRRAPTSWERKRCYSSINPLAIRIWKVGSRFSERADPSPHLCEVLTVGSTDILGMPGRRLHPKTQSARWARTHPKENRSM